MSVRRPEGRECERQQFVEPGVAVDRAGLVQVFRDLQLREAVQEYPQDGREFARRAGAELAFGLGALDQLAQGKHSVIGSGLELLVGLVDRGVAKDELVMVGLLQCVGEVGGTAAA